MPLRYLSQRWRSLGYALSGVRELITSQAHAQIHLAATIVVIAAGIYFDVSRVDWLLLCVAMALVWVAEAINTAIEYVVDLVSPQPHPLAGKAKDVAAGAVLLASFFAACIGCLVFGPKLAA